MPRPDPVFVTADVPWAQFSKGMPYGHYRVIVNPERARLYVQGRLLVKLICLPILGAGAALAIAGYPLFGLPLVLMGLFTPRVVRRKAPELLLHLAMRDPAVYREAIDGEILEVRAPAE